MGKVKEAHHGLVIAPGAAHLTPGRWARFQQLAMAWALLKELPQLKVGLSAANGKTTTWSCHLLTAGTVAG